MAKTIINPAIPRNSKNPKKRRKVVSHGTFRCKRHPNSPRCKKGGADV